jgi:ATP-dependent Lhr-like helicase
MALSELRERGRLLDGEFRPGRTGLEWCDPEVLNQMRRRSLARVRKQVEPASSEAYARLVLDWQGVTAGPDGRVGADALLDVVEQLQGAVIPASILESEVLPARLPRYQRRDLDELCAAGEVIWLGCGALGERDGRVSLYLPGSLDVLAAPELEPLQGDNFDRVRGFLGQYGASFYHDLEQALDGFVGRELLNALWELVWNGEVVNDSPAALRAYLTVQRPQSGRRNRRPLAFRSRRLAPPSSVGRWSLRPSSRRAASVTNTERTAALVEQLLDRYGVLTRAGVAAESVAGGFTAVYPVLRAMEEAGKLRRGYFVEGLGGSQFAHPPALDRLRSLRDDSAERAPARTVVLAAADPANPYGGILAWPRSDDESRTPFSRAAGAYVVIHDGRLVAHVGRGERAIVTQLPEFEPGRSDAARGIGTALAAWALARGQYQPGWQTVDGVPIMQSVLGAFLREAGFVPSGPGLRLGLQPRHAAVGEHA